jgi:hypothetical protein
MNTAEIVELDFLTSFDMKIEQETFTLHGFVAYFDIGFEQDCTTPVLIPTGTAIVIRWPNLQAQNLRLPIGNKQSSFSNNRLS